MRLPNCAVVLALASSSAAIRPRSSKLEACPLLGKQYLPPSQLGLEPKFHSVAKTLDATLNKKTKTPSYDSTAFSVGIFSASDDDLIYQYHHTSPAVANSSYGTNKVDAESIYRIGSISKLLTMYLWLVREGDVRWSDPIAKHLPELLKYKADSWNDVTPDWNAITIGDLAGQMGGLARDYGLDDLALPTNALTPITESIRAAFPDIPQLQVPKCGWALSNWSFVICSADEYLAGSANESPIFSTAYTPVYSNEGFAILGILLQKITGTPVETLFNESLSKPLELKSTYYERPDSISAKDVIPQNPNACGWSTKFGIFSPAGGYVSSLTDFAKFGKDILLSETLSKSVTNRWLKPTSFVQEWSQGVGRPWEILRVKVNGQSVDVYSKSGDWGTYHSFFGLIPDYDIGFTVLTAATPTSDNGDVRAEVPVTLLDAVLPVVDQIARDQTEKSFAGTYTSDQTNSSLTLTTGGNQTGLKITQLISNGVDLFSYVSILTPDLVWRIMPNQLNYGDQKIGFTSFYTSAVPSTSTETTIFTCQGWVDVDELAYGNIPIGQIVFGVDGNGKAQTVDLRGLRTTLKRKA